MAHSCTLERFQKDVADHAIHVLRDDGVNRHLRFKREGTLCMHFDIVTWPGILVITGDMGTSVFTRIHDMFEFFRAGPERRERSGGLYINSAYWAEKCIANDGDKEEFSLEKFNKIVRERFDDYFRDKELPPEEVVAKAELWEQLESEVIDRAGDMGSAVSTTDAFTPDDPRFKDFELSEFWDYNLSEYRFGFIWRLYAIAYAIEQFDALIAAKAAAVPA